MDFLTVGQRLLLVSVGLVFWFGLFGLFFSKNEDKLSLPCVGFLVKG